MPRTGPQTGRTALLLTNKRSGGAAADLAPAIERLEQGGLSVRVETPDSIDDLRRRIRGSAP